MKKATLGVVLFACAITFLSNSQVHALSTPTEDKIHTNAFEYGAQVIDAAQKPKEEKKVAENPAPAPVKEPPIQHAVIEGESLTTIAEKHGSTWIRLFAKNTQIANPNIITVGENIIVPAADEQLPERPLPVPQPQVTPAPSQPAAQSNTSYVPNYGGATSAGNTYSAGYCTWYAKNRRPDLPNSLGNADTWVYRAQTLGIPTGSAPRVGAIGQQGMHVVYVESVNGDGTVTISEMNYQGLYVTSSRTVPAGNFTYIY